MANNMNIEQVWGSVDNCPIALTRDSEDSALWSILLPPDLEDGKYTTIIYARTTYGKIAIWTGILYVVDGISHLHLNESKFFFVLYPDKNIKIIPAPQRQRIEFVLLQDMYDLKIVERQSFYLELKEECDYHGS